MGVPPRVGDEQGYYVIGDVLGEGAMGVVHAAVGPHGEPVAVKFLHAHLSNVPAIVTRFQREAKMVTRFESPFIARVVAVGRTQGRLWMASRRLMGETLEARLARVQVLPVALARVFMEQVAQGLSHAHRAGVVHRDLKPANIFLERLETSERACILDFGISKYTPPPGHPTTSEASLTSTSEVLGTASYMAPEQIDGSEVDARADQYAWAAVAFKVLTGELPSEGRAPMAILHAKLHERARTLCAVTGPLPWSAHLEAVFARALARRPEDRFPDAEAMRGAWSDATMGTDFPSAEELRARLADRSSLAEATVRTSLR